MTLINSMLVKLWSQHHQNAVFLVTMAVASNFLVVVIYH